MSNMVLGMYRVENLESLSKERLNLILKLVLGKLLVVRSILIIENLVI